MSVQTQTEWRRTEKVRCNEVWVMVTILDGIFSMVCRVKKVRLMSSLSIYNTLTGQKEIFESLEPGQVRMYCCGPTVYDYLHVGNFRGAVFYNFVRNWLERLGYKVTYAYNFTDIDDKILNRCHKENRDFHEIVDTYIQAFWEDFNSLQLKPHDLNPRVSEELPSIIKVIEDLIANGMAYEVNGEVFYSIESFKDYGKLSHRKPEDMLSGARIKPDPKKRNPLDFTLWKPVKDGEISWSSPWGSGRPGWHIECTAMIFNSFGPQIDIHGGGLDLVFPHHENEIAQAEGCSHLPFVKYWVHNNMFTFSGTKMSKSLGNIRTMKNFLEHHHPEIFKFLVLSSHYRSQVEFSEKSIMNAINGLCRIYEALKIAQIFMTSKKSSQNSDLTKTFESQLNELNKKISEAYNDDFNTAKAIAYLFEGVRSFNSLCPPFSKKTGEKVVIAQKFFNFTRNLGQDLALFQYEPQDLLRSMDQVLIRKWNLDEKEISRLVIERNEAKKNKDFDRADKIREQLKSMNVRLMDGPEKSHWEIDKKI